MSSKVYLALVAFGAALLFGPTAADAACQLGLVSEYHLIMDGRTPLVDATINGQPVRFIVDFGAYRTIISRAGAERLGLKPHLMHGFMNYGVGGGAEASEAMVQDLKIGNEVAHNVDLLIAGERLKSDHFVGLMGQDLFAQGDVEFDFANHVLRILKPKGCNGDQVVYWNKPYSLATIVPSNEGGQVNIYVTLNGRKAEAALDSGAPMSIVTTAMAERAGVTPTMEGVQSAAAASGVEGQSVKTMAAVFPSLSVGDETIHNAKLFIADMFSADTRKEIGSLIAKRAVDAPDMLLGEDFIRAHRIYVARSQGKMYFSYNGGPIFETTPPSSRAAPDGSSAAKR